MEGGVRIDNGWLPHGRNNVFVVIFARTKLGVRANKFLPSAGDLVSMG
jgi:hypothetical protein